MYMLKSTFSCVVGLIMVFILVLIEMIKYNFKVSVFFHCFINIWKSNFIGSNIFGTMEICLRYG